MEGETSYIYALKEYGVDEVRYVGQTNDVQKRFRSHMRQIPNRNEVNNKKALWIAKARDQGNGIRIIVLETCTKEIANERETYWMNHYRSKGHRLTNGTESGGSGKWCSDQPRKTKVSARKPAVKEKETTVKKPFPQGILNPKYNLVDEEEELDEVLLDKLIECLGELMVSQKELTRSFEELARTFEELAGLNHELSDLIKGGQVK